LPPLDAETMDEHTLEAVTGRVSDQLAHCKELWEYCYPI
jgi:hypothetical protein